MMSSSDARACARRGRVRHAAVVVALCAAAAAFAQGEPPESMRAPAGVALVTQHVIAGGGVTRARSTCFDLAGTVAEPAAGSAEGGNFTLDAGFLAMPLATDSLFRDSFEVCQP